MQRQMIEAGGAGGAGRGMKAIGNGMGRGKSGGASAAGGQMVPMSGGAPNLLDLFNTPHSYSGGGGGVNTITSQMKRLKM